MRRRWHAAAPLLLLLGIALGAPGGAAAQECSEGRISYVFVDNHSIFDVGDMEEDRPFRWVYELANALHFDTRREFIRDELLFREGECYDPLLVSESERLLRNYPFIARVDLFPVPQPDGDVHVVVDTRDEWTTRLDLGVAFDEGFQLETFELTEMNVLGRGIVTGFFFEERRERRDLGMEFETPRLFSTRWDARFSAGRSRAGTFVNQSFRYPFVAEVGRTAARQVFSQRESLFPYRVEGEPGYTHVLLPFEQEFVEVTTGARFGRPGNLTVFGLGILSETISFEGYPDAVEVAAGGDFSSTEPAGPEAVGPLSGQVTGSTIFRINVLAGQRNLRFVRESGLDAVTGVQDVRLGSELSVTVGRALADVGSGSRDAPDDLYLRLRAFGGWAPGEWILSTNLNVEARRVFASAAVDEGWQDVLADADVYAYWRPPDLERHTFFGRISAAGGWSVIRPFQLTLGGRSGIRGHPEHVLPGGRRTLATVEDRIDLVWPLPDLLDVGLSVFGDVGRVWAGDVPFGRTSSIQASVGAGLRLGFPTGSRNVLRVDLAAPLTGPGRFTSPVFRVTFQEVVGLLPGFTDRELFRSRRPGVGTDLLAEERP